jgi:hypothetical protein
VEVRSDDLDPAEMPEAASVHAEMGSVRIPDLRVLNVLLPASGAAVLTAGEASLVGSMDKPAHGKSRVLMQLSGSNMGLDLVGHPLTGDFRVKAMAATVIPGTGWKLPQSMDLSGTAVSIQNVTFPAGTEIPDGWWTTLALPEASLRLGPDPFAAVGKLDVRARDVMPLFALFGSQLGIPKILDHYLDFENLNGTANLLVQPGMVQVTEADLRSTRLRLRGRFMSDATGAHGEMLLDDAPLSFGIALHRHGTGLQLFGAGGWYDERLKTPLAEDD